MANLNATLLDGDLSNNATSILEDPGPIYQSYTFAYFLIGLLITLAASFLNALGVNLQKLDHTRAESVAPDRRRRDCLRPVWVLGLSIYIISQLLGSTLALQYMRAEYVAPLGSASLVFNFLLARVLLGTRITKLDVVGTLVVVLGVVGVIGFGNIRRAGVDEDANLSLDTLHALWGRLPWILYLCGLEIVTGLILWVASVFNDVIEEREANELVENTEDETAFASRGRGRQTGQARSGFFSHIIHRHDRLRSWTHGMIAHWASSRPDGTLHKLDGLLWAVGAGLLAGQTLIYAKSYVKLVTNATSHSGRGSGSDLANPLSILILILLVVTAVAQVWALNKGLKVFDSTLVVPVLFAAYTASGWVDSLIYLHELPIYRTWVLCMIGLCILVLIGGVVLLSSKKPEPQPAPDLGVYDSNADPDGEAQQGSLGLTDIGAREDASKAGLRTMRERSGSVMSLRELGRHLNDRLPSAKPGAKRTGSAATVLASSSRSKVKVRESAPTGGEGQSGLLSKNRRLVGAEAAADQVTRSGGVGWERGGNDAGSEEEDEIDALPGYGELVKGDNTEDDFGHFVDAKPVR